MKPTQALHDLGQSLWLDNITRTMLSDGTLARYIDELSVTGLTSNPTIFDKAISGGDAYDEQIAELSASAITEEGIGATPTERIFFELALADLRDATNLFKDVHERTGGLDGFCSLDVTPLFDDKQYLAAADAYMKGIERRIEAGLSADIASVASIFMSRWDVAVSGEVPDELHNRLGLAIGFQAYRAYRELLDS